MDDAAELNAVVAGVAAAATTSACWLLTFTELEQAKDEHDNRQFSKCLATSGSSYIEFLILIVNAAIMTICIANL